MTLVVSDFTRMKNVFINYWWENNIDHMKKECFILLSQSQRNRENYDKSKGYLEDSGCNLLPTIQNSRIVWRNHKNIYQGYLQDFYSRNINDAKKKYRKVFLIRVYPIESTHTHKVGNTKAKWVKGKKKRKEKKKKKSQCEPVAFWEGENI